MAMTEPSISEPQSATTDNYALNRNYAAASRLNYQYYLWKATLAFSLHPSIPILSSPIRIAEVATGTAIWLQELATLLPTTAQLDGYDISLEQCPPRAWLPKNITLHEWDMFTDVPEHLIGTYDVVHIRLVLLVVAAEKLEVLVRNLALLLRPGGWLQWDELWPGGSYIIHGKVPTEGGVGAEISNTAAMETMRRFLTTLPDWMVTLHDTLMRNGFATAQVHHYKDPLGLARAFFDMYLTTDEEMAEATFGSVSSEQGHQTMHRVSELWRESRTGEGAALCTPKVVIVAQKAVQEVEM
jgi:SAM-dependent methyltransferase